MDRQKAIGLFDSGVGGLTVLAALLRHLPQEQYVYLGDTARLPYGTKSPETITRYALQVCHKLVQENIKLLVVACNTVSAVALPALKNAYPDLPIVGVVEPGAQAAVAATRTKRIAVIGTASTIRGGAYARAIARYLPDAQVTGAPSPLLVPMAEEGWFSGPLVESIIAEYLRPLLDPAATGGSPDTLVLGCTHFPLLYNAIAAVAGPQVTLVDSAQTTARAVSEILTAMRLENTGDHGSQSFFTTDDCERFAATGSLFLGLPLKPADIELVDL